MSKAQFAVVVSLVLMSQLTGCASESLPHDTYQESLSSSTPVISAPPGEISDAKSSIVTEKNTSIPSPVPIVSRTVVIWSDYEGGTQAEIDLFTKAKDCRGLQSYIGMATATESLVRARTGHGNTALLSYINESLTIAACN